MFIVAKKYSMNGKEYNTMMDIARELGKKRVRPSDFAKLGIVVVEDSQETTQTYTTAVSTYATVATTYTTIAATYTTAVATYTTANTYTTTTATYTTAITSYTTTTMTYVTTTGTYTTGVILLDIKDTYTTTPKFKLEITYTSTPIVQNGNLGLFDWDDSITSMIAATDLTVKKVKKYGTPEDIAEVEQDVVDMTRKQFGKAIKHFKLEALKTMAMNAGIEDLHEEIDDIRILRMKLIMDLKDVYFPRPAKAQKWRPWRGVPLETCIALAAEYGVTWKPDTCPKINRMRLVIELKKHHVPSPKETQNVNNVNTIQTA